MKGPQIRRIQMSRASGNKSPCNLCRENTKEVLTSCQTSLKQGEGEKDRKE